METKETVEEAAERIYPKECDSSNNCGCNWCTEMKQKRRGFIDGVNWQAEQLFKDDAIQTLEKGIALLLKKQETMYTEEKVLSILESLIEHPTKPGYKRRDILKFIEQFKKK